jgi:hypothetical protein
MGKEIVVKLKLPESIFLPTYCIISFDTLRNVFTKCLSLHTFPPDLCESDILGISWSFSLSFCLFWSFFNSSKGFMGEAVYCGRGGYIISKAGAGA